MYEVQSKKKMKIQEKRKEYSNTFSVLSQRTQRVLLTEESVIAMFLSSQTIQKHVNKIRKGTELKRERKRERGRKCREIFIGRDSRAAHVQDRLNL